MRRALLLSVGPILVGLLAIPPADAGGGSGGFGGSHGGFGSFRGGFGFHASNGFHGNFVRRPGFVRQHARFAHGFAHRQFANRFAFQNGPNPFAGWWGNNVWNNAFQNGSPARWEGWWGGSGWGGWGWPVGDSSGGYYGYAYPTVQQTQAPAPQPQVIVIHTDGQGRMTTTQAAPDYSYVKGCHAIPNGYHCDTTTETH